MHRIIVQDEASLKEAEAIKVIKVRYTLSELVRQDCKFMNRMNVLINYLDASKLDTLWSS